MSQKRRTELRPTVIAIAIGLTMLLLLQGLSANAGHNGNDAMSGTPHAVTGYVYWPDGNLVDQPLPVTITNARTGEYGMAYVDTEPGGNPDGSYQIDLANSLFFPSGYLVSDPLTVNCSYQNMWVQNMTVVSSGPYTLCDLHLESYLAIQPITATAGGTMTAFDGSFELHVPGNALAMDTVLFAVGSESPLPGSFVSMNLGPDGTVFSPPAVLEWSYDGLDLGGLDPRFLAVYRNIEGAWELLPGYVDTAAKKVIVQVDHFSDFSMGPAQVTGFQTDVRTVYQGASNVPIIGLSIWNPSSADILEHVHAFSNCTDDNDVTGISLWEDSDGDGIPDILISGPAPLLGDMNFTGIGWNVPDGGTLELLITLDVSADATVNNVLDLYIPALGIGLMNSGLSLEVIDPAGDVAIISGLTDPHVVYGFVRNNVGTLPFVQVNLTNNRTGSTVSLLTDDQGRYDVNLGLMPGGYADNDEIFVTANDTLGQTGWNVTYVDISNFGERCDVLILAFGPVAYNETPMNGSVIADIHRNVTVNITGGTGGMDLATIIIEVDGTNYTWGDPNLEFVGETLIFNTTGAVGAWFDGQIVNVTLWQANDTAGNPCQNAPYSWWFQVMSILNPASGLWVEKASADGGVAGDVTIHWTDTNNGNLAYNIFATNDRFNFDFDTPVGTTAPGETNWVHAGANNDGLNWFYIVRPVGGTLNSTMGFKVQTELQARAGYTRVNWVTLPWNTTYYNNAFAVVNEIEGGLGTGNIITAVFKWDPYTQGVGAQAYYSPGPFPPAGWYNDFTINPGDGIALVLQDRGMDWTYDLVINGTDVTDSVTLEARAGYTRVNWVSMPITGIYATAFDVVLELEGSLVTGNNITAVFKWDPYTQGVGVQAYYSPGPFPPAGWYNDFIIEPSNGMALVLQDRGADWTLVWDVNLLTPEV